MFAAGKSPACWSLPVERNRSGARILCPRKERKGAATPVPFAFRDDLNLSAQGLFR